MLPYRGLGSGIKRALEEWKNIDFIDDRDGCLFKVIIHRNLKVQKNKGFEPLNEPITDLQVQILNLIEKESKISYQSLADKLDKGRSTIMRNIQVLKDMNVLKRIGPKKTGYWEIQQSK